MTGPVTVRADDDGLHVECGECENRGQVWDWMVDKTGRALDDERNYKPCPVCQGRFARDGWRLVRTIEHPTISDPDVAIIFEEWDTKI